MPKAKDIWFGPQIDAVAREISKLAIACDVDILQEGIGVKILRNDDSVCGRKNPKAFRLLREHLMAFFEVSEHAIHHLSPNEVGEILQQVIESIRELRESGHPGHAHDAGH
ncbi:MAG: hypothetical protein JSV45_02575 [Chromatiales bacterium]|nr:MAG: hypothetical protein JSV45_02575 [Chromatiales bacterium]